MRDSILVSVVIPTYERYKYLKGAIDSFASIKSGEIEFVIQDNTRDNKEILDYLSSFENDKRIKYYHKAEHVSVVENSDLAVSHASGDYIIFIGDDDTICGSVVDAARYCKEHNIDTCLPELPGFNWPDMEFIGTEKEANLFFKKPATGAVTPIDLNEVVADALRYADGIPEYMPRVYHGLTSRKCLDKIKQITGSYFPGPSPDMASSLAISLVAEKAVRISDYYMVSGYGYKSARGEGRRKAHYGKISEKPWLPKDTEEKWNPEIPKIFSGETIIAESLSRCLQAMGRNDLLNKYSFGTLYAVFFVRHSEAKKYMIRFLLKKPSRLFKCLYGVVNRMHYIRLFRRTHTGQNYKEFNGVTSLKEAQKIAMDLRMNVTSYHD